MSEQMRELTGAEAVAFFLHTSEHTEDCKPLYVCPEKRIELFKDNRLSLLCPKCHPRSIELYVKEIPKQNPLRKPLTESGIQNLLRLPVYSGKHLTGSFVLLDLPEPDNAEEIRSMMEFLGPTIGLAIQNCIARSKIEEHREQLEELVKQRTAELEAANRELSESRLAALNMMEDAILAGKKMEFEQNLFRSFMDTLPAAVYFKDTEGRFISVNKSMADVFDLEPRQMIGKTDFDFFPRKQAEQKRKDSLRTMQSGSPIELEELSGERWHRTIKAPRYDQKGNIAGIYGISWDVTERKQAEGELRRLSTAIEQSPEAVIITNPAGIIEYVNPAFETITGYTRTEAIGKTPNILKSGEHDDVFYKKLWETICGGKTWEGHLINRRKDGSVYTEETNISPVRDEKNQITHYVAVKHDITQELAREEQMKQAQKMEAIGQLAGGIAHDFNNILQSIFGFSELLMISLDETEEKSRSNVQEIQKAAQHAADLTRQLLAFSRKQQVEFKFIDLNNAVRDTLSFVSSVIGENIRVETFLSSTPVLVNADLRQIERTILNLVINARDAMPKGGTLILKTEQVHFSHEDASLMPQAKAGNFACLSISDTGIGMTQQTIKRIFEPFFSTKGPGKGTGLGLSAIYGIIQDHKGWINVYSEPGEGSTFKIYLPARNRKNTGTAKPGSDNTQDEQTQEQGSNQRILVVEDDPAVRNLSQTALSKAGYQVECAPNAEIAEQIFDQQNGAFDLLFSDIILPGKNGAELAAELTGKKPALAVILCSGYSGDRIRKAGIEQKGFFLLEKPFPVVNLLKIVHQVLESIE